MREVFIDGMNARHEFLKKATLEEHLQRTVRVTSSSWAFGLSPRHGHAFVKLITRLVHPRPSAVYRVEVARETSDAWKNSSRHLGLSAESSRTYSVGGWRLNQLIQRYLADNVRFFVHLTSENEALIMSSPEVGETEDVKIIKNVFRVDKLVPDTYDSCYDIALDGPVKTLLGLMAARRDQGKVLLTDDSRRMKTTDETWGKQLILEILALVHTEGQRSTMTASTDLAVCQTVQQVLALALNDYHRPVIQVDYSQKGFCTVLLPSLVANSETGIEEPAMTRAISIWSGSRGTGYRLYGRFARIVGGPQWVSGSFYPGSKPYCTIVDNAELDFVRKIFQPRTNLCGEVTRLIAGRRLDTIGFPFRGLWETTDRKNDKTNKITISLRSIDKDEVIASSEITYPASHPEEKEIHVFDDVDNGYIFNYLENLSIRKRVMFHIVSGRSIRLVFANKNISRPMTTIRAVFGLHDPAPLAVDKDLKGVHVFELSPHENKQTSADELPFELRPIRS